MQCIFGGQFKGFISDNLKIKVLKRLAVHDLGVETWIMLDTSHFCLLELNFVLPANQFL